MKGMRQAQVIAAIAPPDIPLAGSDEAGREVRGSVVALVRTS